MTPDPLYLKQPKRFWAHVRTISQHVGYTQKELIRVPSLNDVLIAMWVLGLKTSHLADARGKPTEFGQRILSYFEYRAKVLKEKVEPALMNKDSAKLEFEKIAAKCNYSCPIPMNKQKGAKQAPAYFTAIVNMLIERSITGLPCDYDPRELTTITKKGEPLRTLARRVDGAFPGPVNPISVWEIKEYYYTTTFGSRVADGVYESLLDGMELEELREHEKIDVKHYLMVDDHLTWWGKGRSYLCRIIDMLHMGYVDEVLFGREVLERLPQLAEEWASQYRSRSAKT